MTETTMQVPMCAPVTDDTITPPAPSERQQLLQLVTAVPEARRWPGAWSLAFLHGELAPAGQRDFALDRDVRWLTLRYIPPGFTRQAQEGFWRGCLYRTVLTHGMPSLNSAGRLDEAFDIAAGHAEGRVEAAADAMLASLLSAGFADPFVSESYGPAKAAWDAFLAADGKSDIRRRYQAAEAGTPAERYALIVAGGDAAFPLSQSRGDKSQWLPRPYLGFRLGKKERLWRACCEQQLGNDDNKKWERVVPAAVLFAFGQQVREHHGVPIQSPLSGRVEQLRQAKNGGILLVLRGKVDPHAVRHLTVSPDAELEIGPGDDIECGQWLGKEPVGDWNEELEKSALTGLFWKLRKTGGARRLDSLLADWFDRQLWHIMPGMVHGDARLFSRAATRSETEALLWDITPAIPFYDQVSESFVFPPNKEMGLGACRFEVPAADRRGRRPHPAPHLELRCDFSQEDDVLDTYTPYFRMSSRSVGYLQQRLSNEQEAAGTDAGEQPATEAVAVS